MEINPKTQFIVGYEGFLKKSKDISFLGFGRVDESLALSYVIEQDWGRMTLFSICLSYNEACSLAKALRERMECDDLKSVQSYGDDCVRIFCCGGTLPLVSFIERRYSFRLMFLPDYKTLLEYLDEFLISRVS